MRQAIRTALDAAIERLEALDLGDAYEPRAAQAIVEAGLHRLCVPAAAGGFEATMAEATEVLARLGAADGATGLGFAMHVHATGALRDAADGSVPTALRDGVWAAIVDRGALVNNAATEEGGGSPARGAVPGTIAAAPAETADPWRLTGEKTWTTWLPALSHAFVTARLGDAEPGGKAAGDPVEVGVFMVDLAADGVERRPGFEALGMRGSASGRLVLRDAPGTLVIRRAGNAPDPRGPAPMAWFGLAVASVYLGVGEGARDAVARWALDRRPGDGSTAVADIPSVQLRLGRIDLRLRAARIVVGDVARRWDGARAADDIALAKLVATGAAVEATDEALRIAGGPGFLAGRLERALRDARAGLINPPLEDVALAGFAKSVLGRVRDGR